MPPRRLSSSLIALAGLLVTLFAASNASAHPEGFSQVRAILRNDSVHLELEIHTRDLAKQMPGVTDASAVKHLDSIGWILYEVRVNYNPLDRPSVKATIIE